MVWSGVFDFFGIPGGGREVLYGICFCFWLGRAVKAVGEMVLAQRLRRVFLFLSRFLRGLIDLLEAEGVMAPFECADG